ncbi:MAG: EAL domain-containing protein [Alkalinema sp. RU_4_3]|nr:EAL domain-containing protein [Alkalinema sp. RU_4_3]
MRTILVIEDDRSIRAMLSAFLSQEGFHCVVAQDGLLGVQIAKDILPDLIICDVRMPNLDGYEVLGEIRSDVALHHIPFIFLSGKSEGRSIRQGMNLGADDYLIKPIDRRDLIEAVHARLKKQTLQSQAWSSPQRIPPAQETGQDILTGLPGRLVLTQALQRAIGQMSQYQQTLAFLCININRFRSVNTAFGYPVGDRLLRGVGQRLSQLLEGRAVVARLSGDEFGIILDDLFWERDALAVAEELWQALAEPFEIEGQALRIQVSIGGAFATGSCLRAEQLLTQADLARRSTIATGCEHYRFYDPSLAELDVEHRWIEMELTRALERDEFLVYYQPQVDLASGYITGVEALLRWRHPQRGMISPETFIRRAEEMGLIIPLGEWVLRTACSQMKAWATETNEPLKLSVNLSICQLQQPNLVKTVMRILAETDLHPRQLTLELTETQFMNDIDSAVQTLQELRHLGMQIAIDDFGKGYSSLQYLSQLPIDVLKIDQSFVRQVTEDQNAAAISQAIITMARELRLGLVAEGVETSEQVEFLRSHGCGTVQGHLFSPALKAQDLTALLSRPRQRQKALV